MDADQLTGASLNSENGTLWVYFPLDRQWWATCRMTARNGEVGIAELRVLPRPKSDAELEWLEKHAGPMPSLVFEGRVFRGEPPQEPKVPRGGLTARALRELRLGRARELLSAEHLGDLVAGGVRELLDQGVGQDAFPALDGLRAAFDAGQPGSGRPDAFYATVAAVYVEIVSRGEMRATVATAQALSDRLGRKFNPTQVRDLLNEARNRRLLTRPPKGRAGGRLTKKGERAVREGTDT